MSKVVFPPSLHEGDDVEEEVNECYGLNQYEDETTEEYYCELV